MQKVALILALGFFLSACSTVEKLSRVGEAPDLKPIENPTQKSSYKPVSLPMPAPSQERREANALWRTGAKSFFRDQRARTIGDILTVQIDISDSATVSNTSSRSRTSAADADLTALLGIETGFGNILPEGYNPATAASVGNTSSNTGTGEIDRSEDVSLTVAALVTQTLPNGNFVIMGRQEVRINHELRELIITGIVRPEDITNQNTVAHTQIAEARISYGGRGQVSDIQQPSYGQQIYDVLFPF